MVRGGGFEGVVRFLISLNRGLRKRERGERENICLFFPSSSPFERVCGGGGEFEVVVRFLIS